MNSRSTRMLVALGATAVMALPAGAAARGGPPPGHGHGAHGGAGQDQVHGRSGGHSQGDQHRQGKHGRALNLAGTVTAVGDGTVQVAVTHANHHGHVLVGQTVTVDVSEARIVVADTNGDGARDLTDVAVGDVVGVHARIAKDETPDPAQPIAARQLNDRGAPQAPDSGSNDGSGDDVPAPVDTP